MVEVSVRMATVRLKCPGGIEKDGKCMTDVSGKSAKSVIKVSTRQGYGNQGVDLQERTIPSAFCRWEPVSGQQIEGSRPKAL